MTNLADIFADHPAFQRRPSRSAEGIQAAAAALMPAEVETDANVLPELSLREFSQEAWHVVEPGRPFVSNWHIDAICEHLEAVSFGEIRNLLINIPPRHMKSTLVSVFWPAWKWTFRPEFRWLFASYAQRLATRDSRKCRLIINSRWFKQHWGGLFTLTSDQNEKTRFENDKTGYRIATSVDGQGTGEGGDIVAVDDPHNVKKAISDKQREAALIWWDETMSTRLNDPKTGGRVIVMQRLHERDLSGHVLEQGGYEHLCIPARYEPKTYVIGQGFVAKRHTTAIGWTDPREVDGELLWPDRFGEKELEDLKLPPSAQAGQLQQRPSPRGGGKIKRQWFTIVDAAPADAKRVRWWDLAGTEPSPTNPDPDWTAGPRVSLKDGVFYIEDVQRKRLSPHGVEQLVKQTAMTDGVAVPVGIEQEPGSSGKTTIDHYRRNVLVGFDVRSARATGDKEIRANPWISAAEAGNVKLVRGDWNTAFLDEVEVFPFGAHDDQVDGVSGAVAELADTRAPGDIGISF